MSATLEIVKDSSLYKLGPQDRCDRCGSQAYVEAIFSAGSLLLCRHHAHEHDGAIKDKAVAVRDETSQLIAE